MLYNNAMITLVDDILQPLGKILADLIDKEEGIMKWVTIAVAGVVIVIAMFAVFFVWMISSATS